MDPQVMQFHDVATSTFTYVVYDQAGGTAAVVDPVLDYDPASAWTSTTSADRVLAFVRARQLQLAWVLETHVHADHLTAADYLRRMTGARVAIGAGIVGVQRHFKRFFGLEADFSVDGRQFDLLLDDGDTFAIGGMHVRAIATPGHTADSLTYLIGNAAFVGDTVFAPETGTARTDFPGGDAQTLYRSIHTLFHLPPATRLFLCHDYPAAGREPMAQTSIQAQAQANVHVGGGISEQAFVALRAARDAQLAVPRLLLPALQVNLRAGALPPPDHTGNRSLRLPLNQWGAA
ncbi:MBL fold metallo-hydrolase [Xanthomonas campestris]|uniref:MBL fold metallo-hydrolase n=1 Tax=Xanthomonas campestris TaxID=339 RepID=UPI000E1EA964|nr:MBL fold metallo-hydrolase [Xanthomonas campestris]